MNDLIKINFENEGLALLERQAKTRYNDRFKRMCKYSLRENRALLIFE